MILGTAAIAVIFSVPTGGSSIPLIIVMGVVIGIAKVIHKGMFGFPDE